MQKVSMKNMNRNQYRQFNILGDFYVGNIFESVIPSLQQHPSQRESYMQVK